MSDHVARSRWDATAFAGVTAAAEPDFDEHSFQRHIVLDTSRMHPGLPRTLPVDTTIGELVRNADTGDPAAANALFAALYRELHALAERELHRGGAGLSMGTTTLLHETYLNLSARDGLRFANRAHFLGYACRAMRGLMIDFARRRRALKRGGEFQLTQLPLDQGAGLLEAHGDQADGDQLEALGDALTMLTEVNPGLAQLVDLHFFCGIQLAEVAALRGVSERTVSRDWRRARLLLRHALRTP